MSILAYLLDRSLAHVQRFNNRPNHFPESDATHSFYTAHYAHILCLMVIKIGMKVDVARVLAMALIHDLEEGQSGDILNPFKHHSTEVTAAIHKVNEEMIKVQVEELPDYMCEEIIALWRQEQERKTLESQIVKVADVLSLISKCNEEIQAGNNYFQGIYTRELKNLKALDWKWWQKIRDKVLAGAEQETD